VRYSIVLRLNSLIWRTRRIRRMSHEWRLIFRHHRLRRYRLRSELDLVRRRRILEAPGIRRRSCDSSTLMRWSGRIRVLASGILHISRLRVRNIRTGRRSRCCWSYRILVVCCLLSLLHISRSFRGWEICVSSHGDRLAALTSRHLSVTFLTGAFYFPSGGSWAEKEVR
jgi:hypothetical protein